MKNFPVLIKQYCSNRCDNDKQFKKLDAVNSGRTGFVIDGFNSVEQALKRFDKFFNKSEIITRDKGKFFVEYTIEIEDAYDSKIVKVSTLTSL